jgi:pentatricopeptide repeat protein
MEASGLAPGVAAYNAILRRLCEDGNLKEVNRLLNEMDERKVPADHVTCNTLINAYCKRGDMASACKVRRKMVESGLQLNQFTYKALVHGFCKARELDKAKEALFEMVDAGIYIYRACLLQLLLILHPVPTIYCATS